MLDQHQKTLDNIKRILLRQQKEVEENLKAVEKHDPAKDSILAEASEPGTESWIAEGHVKATALGTQLKEVAGSVKAALLKIKQGNYGICEKCHKRIETKRLLAIPTTRFCMSCSKKTSK